MQCAFARCPSAVAAACSASVVAAEALHCLSSPAVAPCHIALQMDDAPLFFGAVGILNVGVILNGAEGLLLSGFGPEIWKKFWGIFTV